MDSSSKPYQKLPGGGTMVLTYAQLFRASDHMLHVVSTGFTETYHRFFFSDVQSITIQKTHAGKLINAVFGGIALVFSSMFLVPQMEGVGVFFTVLFGIPLLLNTALGPTAATYVQTAVQRQQLKSLGRLRTARKTLRILTPLIEAVQGRLEQDDLMRLLGHGAPVSPATSVASAPQPDAERTERTREPTEIPPSGTSGNALS